MKFVAGLLAAFGAVGGVAAFLVGAIILMPLLGALSGLVIGWVFNDTIALWFDVIGWQGKAWQFGLVLGYISSYFRASWLRDVAKAES